MQSSRIQVLAAVITIAAFFSVGAHCHDRSHGSSPLAAKIDGGTERPGLDISNRGSQPLTVHLAVLKESMNFDCNAIRQQRPFVPLHSFGPRVPTSIPPKSTHHVETTNGECQLVRIDGDEGIVGIGVLYAGRTEALEIRGTSWNASSSWYWRLSPVVANAPPLPRCGPSKAHQLSWSAPIPVGKDLRILGLSQSRGCTQMRIGSATANSALDWKVCSGDELPLAVGDTVAIDLQTVRATEDVSQEALTITKQAGIVKTSITLEKGAVNQTRTLASKPLTYLRGSYSAATPPCVRADPCQDSWLPAALNVRFADNQLSLRTGDHAKLGGPDEATLALRVLRARARYVSPKHCSADLKRPTEIHSVAVLTERVKPEMVRAVP